MRIMLDHTLLHRGNLLLVNAQHPLKDRTIDDLTVLTSYFPGIRMRREAAFSATAYPDSPSGPQRHPARERLPYTRRTNANLPGLSPRSRLRVYVAVRRASRSQ